jgi:hypothetical protein
MRNTLVFAQQSIIKGADRQENYFHEAVEHNGVICVKTTGYQLRGDAGRGMRDDQRAGALVA